jgi:hypothetical protein
LGIDIIIIIFSCQYLTPLFVFNKISEYMIRILNAIIDGHLLHQIFITDQFMIWKKTATTVTDVLFSIFIICLMLGLIQ